MKVSQLVLDGGAPVRSAPWPKWPESGVQEQQALSNVALAMQWGGIPIPGPRASEFANQWANYIGTKHCVLTSSGTAALVVALRAAGIKAGDEVIVPSLTWVATASAVVELNGVPVFADIEPESLCMDPNLAEAAITSLTKAIIVVHLGSSMVNIEKIVALCRKHNLILIEDCAHAHGMQWEGQGAGSFGDLGCFSFQSSKLLTSGEGGAVVTNDREFAMRCYAITNCGSKEYDNLPFRGTIFGSNYRITEFQAALLDLQFKRLPEQIERRATNLQYFIEALSSLGDIGLRSQKQYESITRHSFFEFILLYDQSKWLGLHRDEFVKALRAEGIGRPWTCDGLFYRPVQDCIDGFFAVRSTEYPCISARYGDMLTPDQAPCPITRVAAYEQTIWFHHSLFLGSTADMDDIISAILKIKKQLPESETLKKLINSNKKTIANGQLKSLQI
jgi:dTDP-4-amino-4,6-dideoxygalactose transaminase